MKIYTREKEGVVILDLEGNIDINSADLIEMVGWILNHKSKNIICNFEGINLIDHIGITALAIIYKNVLNHKGRIKFCNVPSHVQKLFSIVGLNRVLACYLTEEDAIRSFKEDKVISEIMKLKLRRRFRRVPFKNTIEYKGKFSSREDFYKGKMLNLSGVGAFLIGEKTFPVGTILLTRLHLMPKPGIIEVEAKVIWISQHKMPPLEYPAMGIEFYNISSEQQRIIIEFVDKHIAR